ncbi:DNA polymerase delta, subunit 4-domain-containing protein [Absidia repens]|uniref:DNA polymerase delta, subunit 4-domain-containing protein n=1 Tax=Absidia repens TaxID=90262 RepID=A0A1X2I865_9FUNG|nr:DNA polymerase delta, subunit 4-domain-containing protein [Absidia repens]
MSPKQPQQRQSSIKTRLTRPSRNGAKRGKKVESTNSPLFDDPQKMNKKAKEKHSTIDVNKKDTTNVLNDLAPPRPIEVHQENMKEIDKQLRAFDLDYSYGPCVGLTRLERWERAASLGLDPPEEIKTILLKNKEYKECLFHGSVI